MSESNPLACCGITELDGVSDQKSPARTIAELIQDDEQMRHTGIVLFTGAAANKRVVRYTEELSNYIKKFKLGKVIRHSPVKNRNTGRFITLYVWNTDKAALDKWYETNKKARKVCGCGDPTCYAAN